MTSPYRITRDVRIPTRDGVDLSANVYRPLDQVGRLPVILSVTPYGTDYRHETGVHFASRGWIFVAVDARGRGNSDGAFYPFRDDGRDAFDAVEWLAGQPWCDGQVAMWGGSYGGFNQWATLREAPPHLRAIAPTASVGLGIDVPFNGGIAEPYVMQWHVLTAGRTVNRQLSSDETLWRESALEAMRSGQAFANFAGIGGEAVDWFRETTSHPVGSAHWAALRPSPAEYAAIGIPVLSITGAYDDDQAGALHYYREHMRHGAPGATARHHLVIGPWDHAGTRRPSPEVGGLRFGDASVVDLLGLQLAWYEMALRGGPRPALLADRVVYYMAGAEEWRSAPSLEAVTASALALHLGSGVGAGDVFHSGTLTAAPAAGAPSDAYTYDPLDLRPAELEADPLPDYVTSERLVMQLFGNGLVYHSEPLPEPLELAGFARLTAWISIDAPDTDFEVDLYEVTRDGGSVWLTRDMQRARHRASQAVEVPAEPGAVLPYDFAGFFFFARRIAAGSRLRLVIRCPNSPRFEKNYNGGGVVARETSADARACRVTVFHDPEHPAVLVLPAAGGGGAGGGASSVGGTVCAQAVDPGRDRVSLELETARDRLTGAVVSARARSGVPSISAGVVFGDDLVWSLSVGQADQTTGRLADVDTPYRIASITKTFTASAVLQLRDQGRLNLGDPLTVHIPEFAAAHCRFGPIEQVTLRSLLTHTSGLQANPPLADPSPLEWGYRTTDEILANLGQAAVVVPPNSRWKYSNLGYELLGELVHRVSGQSFARYLRDNITDPLAMTATEIDPEGARSAFRARGYDERTYTDELPLARVLADGWGLAAGGLWSSVSDLSRWISFQFRTGSGHHRGPGQVLDGSTLAEMHRPAIVRDEEVEVAQGLAWGTWRHAQLLMTGHAGGVPGFMSQIAFNGRNQFGVIVLANGAADVRELALELADIVAPFAAAHVALREPQDLPGPTPDAWRPLLGLYGERGSTNQVRVEVRGGRLVIAVVGSPSSSVALEPTADPVSFLLTDGPFIGEELRFTCDQAGRVMRLVMGSAPFLRLDQVAQQGDRSPSAQRQGRRAVGMEIAEE